MYEIAIRYSRIIRDLAGDEPSGTNAHYHWRGAQHQAWLLSARIGWDWRERIESRLRKGVWCAWLANAMRDPQNRDIWSPCRNWDKIEKLHDGAMQFLETIAAAHVRIS